MKRALFIFAKLNPGLRYVQGMNELLAPLYYHFRLDPDREASAHAEADAFFCFMDIISEFRDNFCQQLVRILTKFVSCLSGLNTCLQRLTPSAASWRSFQNPRTTFASSWCAFFPQFRSYDALAFQGQTSSDHQLLHVDS